MTGTPDPLVLPPDEFEAVQKVAGMLGMDRPAPALGERPAAAAEPGAATLTEAAVAAIAADAEWARTHPCGPTWTRPPYEQVRRLIAAEWERAEAAEAKVLEYENAITWGTSCLSCSRVLDSAYAETVRREQAEAKLAGIHAYCRTHPERAGAGFPQMASDILAITGSETREEATYDRDFAGPVL